MSARYLGDAGASNDDASYTGEVSTSPLSLDYFRAKYAEFQVALQSADAAYRAAQTALEVSSIPADVRAGLRAVMTQYESRRATLRNTAQILNEGARLANAVGLRMPQLSIPQTLNAIPFMVPIAIAGGVAVAVSLVQWINGFVGTARTYILRAQQFSAAATPEERQALVAAAAAADAAQAQTASSPLARFAQPLKWAAIAFAAYLAWKAFSDR